MTFVKRYLIPRLIQYILVIWVGITVVFLIPRLTPNDPVMKMIDQMRARGSTLEPGAMDGIINDLTEMYGLGGSWLEQYRDFWGRLVQGDFGVSFFQFPTRVNQLIGTALPWTLGLLLTSTALSWILGNIIGGLAGYYGRKRWSRGLDAIAMVIRPLPYYIFAFVLLLLLTYVARWFPVTGGSSLGAIPAFTWDYIKDVLWHSTLPALSLTILGGAVNFQIMKLLVQNVNAENFVQYAKLGGVTEGRIVSSRGLNINARDYHEHFAEEHVPHSTALHCRLKARGHYKVGPLARYALNHDLLSPLARQAAQDAGLGRVCRNPFQSIVVRAVETVYAVDEALRILEAAERPHQPCVEVRPRAGRGLAATEAPRGLLHHTYELDEQGRITFAQIIPPTSQNQATIEADLRRFIAPRLHLPDDQLRWQCEQAVRNYDPCISCSTHFLKLKVERR